MTMEAPYQPWIACLGTSMGEKNSVSLSHSNFLELSFLFV